MKFLSLLTCLVLTSIQGFSCDGVEEITLNDSKVLTAFSIYDTSSKVHYSFYEDLGEVNIFQYAIGDSTGKETHLIVISKEDDEVIVRVYPWNEGPRSYKTYIAQKGRMRGCNEIREVTE